MFYILGETISINRCEGKRGVRAWKIREDLKIPAALNNKLQALLQKPRFSSARTYCPAHKKRNSLTAKGSPDYGGDPALPHRRARTFAPRESVVSLN